MALVLEKDEILGGMSLLIRDGEMTVLEGHVILTRELIARLMSEGSTMVLPSFTRAMGEPDKLIIIGKLLELKRDKKLPDFLPTKGRNKFTPMDWIQHNLKNEFLPNVIDALMKNPEYWFQVDKKLYQALNMRRYRGTL